MIPAHGRGRADHRSRWGPALPGGPHWQSASIIRIGEGLRGTASLAAPFRVARRDGPSHAPAEARARLWGWQPAGISESNLSGR